MNAHGKIGGRKRQLKARAIEEARRFAVMFFYLWILFGLFVLNERVIRGQQGPGFFSQGFAVIHALVLAKVMLIAEDLNLGHRLNERPLIYPILYQSFAFTALFIVFHVVEKEVIGLFKGGTLASSVPAIGGGGFAGLLCVSMILFIALIPFFASKNISRVLGADRMYALLFRTSTDGSAAASAAEQVTLMKEKTP
jgi:hypothetical protein